MTKARDLSQTPNASLGFKNRIINGNMTISQRTAGASVTVNSGVDAFPVDRFACSGHSADGVFTAQQSSVAPSGFTRSVICTVTTADSSIGATQRYFIEQKVEGFNTADFMWGTANAQTVTLSFWVRSSLTGTFGGSLVGGQYYPFSYVINAANTWEYKTVTVAGSTSGTWDTTNGVGVEVLFSLGCGSSRKGTANAWTDSVFLAPTGSVDLIATNGATFYITGVQLEKGSTATSFDYRPYGTELMLCQRYCQFNQSATGEAGSSTEGAFVVPFYVVMRATPTMSLVVGTDRIDEFYAGRKTITSVGVVYGNSAAGTGVGITLNSSGLTGNALLGLFSGCLLFSAEL